MKHHPDRVRSLTADIGRDGRTLVLQFRTTSPDLTEAMLEGIAADLRRGELRLACFVIDCSHVAVQP
ncbi:hypothetical protein [Segnochrobactrum spirostomi]|uniref:Uncharacterized protein n=1 Tax=Segnochrobactrum spirostomi TaxID=2608987 RepID=A0A6A7Y7N6_9HYPH|nr:hypothetical protein [Segnochrobactrum spirostomi]MQT13672.1 hypothetical protein [Segnochrobactrum spirostomi]